MAMDRDDRRRADRRPPGYDDDRYLPHRYSAQGRQDRTNEPPRSARIYDDDESAYLMSRYGREYRGNYEGDYDDYPGRSPESMSARYEGDYAGSRYPRNRDEYPYGLYGVPEFPLAPYGRPYRGYGGRGWSRRDYGGHDYGPDDDRGFIDRAGDEFASWFGDEEARQRRAMDHGHRGRGPKNYRRSDDRIREDVSDRIADDPRVDASDLEVSVNDGEVTLDGTVDHRFVKRHTEDIVEMISGVKHVQNNLRARDPQSNMSQSAPATGTGTSRI